jgi:hypothetical protein
MFPILPPNTAIPVSWCASKAPIVGGTTGFHIPGTPPDIDPKVATGACGAWIMPMGHASLLRMEAAGNPVPDPVESREEGSPHREVCETIEAIETPCGDCSYVRDMGIGGNIPGGKGGK